jgi:hypothetical protein
LADPEIAAEIERQQNQATEPPTVETPLSDRAMLLKRVDGAIETAEQSRNAAAMIAGLSLKARLIGIDKASPDEDAERAAANRRELVTAAKLMGDAALSMGLPAHATPSQLIGAISVRPIATPEVFRLLRAKALAEEAEAGVRAGSTDPDEPEGPEEELA